MNFNENDLWRDKTELLNLRLSKLPSKKVLLKLEFDTEDQVLFYKVSQKIAIEASFPHIFVFLASVIAIFNSKK